MWKKIYKIKEDRYIKIKEETFKQSLFLFYQELFIQVKNFFDQKFFNFLKFFSDVAFIVISLKVRKRKKFYM